MKISKSYNKNTGVTYVYEVLENHWDPVLKQARNTRRCIGKLDPVTGEIVPTRKRKKKEAASDQPSTQTDSADTVDFQKLYNLARDEIQTKNDQIEGLNREIQSLKKELSSLTDSLDSISSSLKALNGRI